MRYRTKDRVQMILFFGAIMLFTWFLLAWGIMIGVNVAHYHWWSEIPLIGFGTSLTISYIWLFVGTVVSLVLGQIAKISERM